MTIQATALAKALGLLKVAGVVYAVITPDGETCITEGYELRTIPTAKPKKTGDYTKTVAYGAYAAVYRPVLEAMQVGDVKTVTADTAWKLDWFRASMGSYASNHWGDGSYLTEQDQSTHTVTIARIV